VPDGMQRDVPAAAVCHDPLLRTRVFLDLALELPGEPHSSPHPGSMAVAVRPSEWHHLTPGPCQGPAQGAARSDPRRFAGPRAGYQGDNRSRSTPDMSIGEGGTHSHTVRRLRPELVKIARTPPGTSASAGRSSHRPRFRPASVPMPVDPKDRIPCRSRCSPFSCAALRAGVHAEVASRVRRHGRRRARDRPRL
jgi:hypothetical protein